MILVSFLFFSLHEYPRVFLNVPLLVVSTTVRSQCSVVFFVFLVFFPVFPLPLPQHPSQDACTVLGCTSAMRECIVSYIGKRCVCTV